MVRSTNGCEHINKRGKKKGEKCGDYATRTFEGKIMCSSHIKHLEKMERKRQSKQEPIEESKVASSKEAMPRRRGSASSDVEEAVEEPTTEETIPHVEQERSAPSFTQLTDEPQGNDPTGKPAELEVIESIPLAQEPESPKEEPETDHFVVASQEYIDKPLEQDPSWNSTETVDEPVFEPVDEPEFPMGTPAPALPGVPRRGLEPEKIYEDGLEEFPIDSLLGLPILPLRGNPT